MAYDNMINHFNIKKPGGFPDLIGQFLIRFAGFQITGRMIMAKNDIHRM